MLCLFQFLANGTMVIKQVYMEDQGMYGCTANNTAGRTRTEAYVYIAGEWNSYSLRKLAHAINGDFLSFKN